MMTTELQTTDDLSINDIVLENLGGALSGQDLIRVKMPSGGGIAFEVPIPADEPDVVKTIEGVIIAHTPLRQYFVKIEDQNRLECSSTDGITGVGNPGGACRTCPLNAWGSSTKGKGKACADKIALYIMRDDDILPIYLALPPTSLAPFRKFMVDLSLRKLPYYGVRTKIGLKKIEVSGRDPYSIVTFALVNVIDKAEMIKHRAYRDSFMPLLLQPAAEPENIVDAGKSDDWFAPNETPTNAPEPAASGLTF